MEHTHNASPVRTTLSPGLSLGMGESFKIALESLRANKLRTFLTMLGIIIGVWSVVALLSIGTGAQQLITDQVSSIGTNLLTVQPGANQNGPPGAVSSTAQNLTIADVEAIERSVPEVERLAPEFQSSGQVIAGSENRTVQVSGTTADYAIVRNVAVARGQFLTEEMVDGVRPVAVLGSEIASELFGDADPVGQTIRLAGKALVVVGVLEPGNGLSQTDNAVFVPLTTAQRVLFDARAVGSGSYRVSSVALQIRSADQIELAQAKVEQILRRQHRLPEDGESDDFTVFNQASLLSTLTTITTALTLFLGAIAGISLLVGGIGVMNIMLVSVTERTKEIGLRKAVGAKRRNILQQFLVEALVMSILGGLIGLGLGYVTAWAVALTELITPIVTPTAVLMALGFSAAVGLFFGVYPAQRAARLNPIQALRYE